MITFSIKKALLIFATALLSSSGVFAASFHIESPVQAPAYGRSIVVHIVLDTENDVLSGFSGNFSFPKELFTLASIDIDRSAVPLWVVQPSLSEEKYLDNRTHITFEGIFPGGFDGVRSPLYQGKKPGIVFSVTLTPKAQGVGSFIVDDVVFHAFTAGAELLPSTDAVAYIRVPSITDASYSSQESPSFIAAHTLEALVTHDPLVDNNAWYLVVQDKNPTKSLAHMYVAETKEYDAHAVASASWRLAKNPYVLLYQERNMFIHIKYVYSDNTYTILTLPPVENSHQISQMSRILVSVVIVLFVMYLYVRSFFHSSFHHTKQK